MDTNLYSVCELTTEQKKAFNKLKNVRRQAFTLLIATVI